MHIFNRIDSQPVLYYSRLKINASYNLAKHLSLRSFARHYVKHFQRPLSCNDYPIFKALTSGLLSGQIFPNPERQFLLDN